MSQKIKGFLFDYGGVITGRSLADNEVAERLAQNLNIPQGQANELIGSIWRPFVLGALTEPEVWKSLEKQYGKPIGHSKRNVWDQWGDMPPIPEMLSLVQQLRASGYKVGLLSNVMAYNANDIREHGVYDGFDFLVLSYEQGFAKPDPEIYDIALKKLGEGIKPTEVVFLDDKEECLAPAREIGIKTILVESHQQAVATVKKLLDK